MDDDTRPSSSTPHMRDGVVAVVTALNPPADLPLRVKSLQSQVDLVIVVDDGSGPDASDVFAELQAIGAQVLLHKENSGIAAALNTGVRASIAQNAKAVLTLDQDSTPDPGYVQACIRAVGAAAESGRPLGFVCPRRMNGIDVPANRGKNVNEPYDPMQSGMFIPIQTFHRVGLFEEELFIDAVDSEFTLRVRAAGLTVEFAEDTDLQHALGEERPKTLFGRTLTHDGVPELFSAHSPMRLYYVARNRLITNLRYVRYEPGWVIRRAYDDAIFAGRNIVFGPAKRKTIIAIAFGLSDGIRHRLGKINPRLATKLATPK